MKMSIGLIVMNERSMGDADFNTATCLKDSDIKAENLALMSAKIHFMYYFK